MKKIIIYILSVAIFATNVYAKEVWFILTPNIDNTGKVINSDDYDDVKGVDMEFRIAEFINKILQ